MLQHAVVSLQSVLHVVSLFVLVCFDASLGAGRLSPLRSSAASRNGLSIVKIQNTHKAVLQPQSPWLLTSLSKLHHKQLTKLPHLQHIFAGLARQSS